MQSPYAPKVVGMVNFHGPMGSGNIPILLPKWEDRNQFTNYAVKFIQGVSAAPFITTTVEEFCEVHANQLPTPRYEILIEKLNKLQNIISFDEPENCITTQKAADVYRRASTAYFVFNALYPCKQLLEFTKLFNPILRGFNDDVCNTMKKLIELGIMSDTPTENPAVFLRQLSGIDPFSSEPICNQLFKEPDYATV